MKEEEASKNVCAFRIMARKMKSSRKEGVKRLQEGPKRAREAEDQKKMTKYVMRRLVERLAKEIPEIKMGEEARKMQKMERRTVPPPKMSHATSQDEECLAMLGGLTLYKKEAVELSKEFETLKLVEEKIKFTIQNAKKKDEEEPRGNTGVENN